MHRSTSLIVLLCMATLAAPARAQMQTSDKTNPTKLYTALIAAAGDRFDLDRLPLSLYLQDDQVALWSISLPEDDGEQLVALLDAVPYARGIEHMDSRDAPLLDRLIAWSRQINEDLAAITAHEFKQAGREHYNPDLDYEFSVSGHVLPVETYGDDWFYASFDHRRLKYLGRPESDLELLDQLSPSAFEDPRVQDVARELREKASRFGPLFPQVDPPAPSGESQLTWIIQVRKTIWDEGETIKGRITIRDTGSRRIHVQSGWGLSLVAIRDLDGREPLYRVFGSCISLELPTGPWNTYFGPGFEFTSDFSICTDPEGAFRSGYIVPPGQYILSRPPIDNVIMHGEPVTIEVRAPQNPNPDR